MKTEQFLHFWSLHNATIIEVLIAVILVSFIYLAFRTFFQEDSQPEVGTSSQFNTAEIEKTLQKLVEAQSSQRAGFVEHGAAAGATAAPGAEGLSAAAVAAAQSLGGAAQQAEVQKMTQQIQEKDQQVVELKKLLEVAQAASAASSGGAAAGAAANPDLDKKIKDLEARLAEYEIISEDIADLSFYKEENAKLQKELITVKGGGVAPSVPPSASAAPPPVAAPEIKIGDVVAATDGTPGPSAGVMPSSPMPDGSLIDSAVAQATPPPADNTAIVNSAIDDELMKEFAAAVKDQKPAGGEAVEKVVVEDQKKLAENENLMGEFENFVKKG